MKIPLVDLKAQYKTIEFEIGRAIQNVIENSAFIGGEQVEKFEHAFAQKHDAKYCIGTSSGTNEGLLVQGERGYTYKEMMEIFDKCKFKNIRRLAVQYSDMMQYKGVEAILKGEGGDNGIITAIKEDL